MARPSEARRYRSLPCLAGPFISRSPSVVAVHVAFLVPSHARPGRWCSPSRSRGEASVALCLVFGDCDLELHLTAELSSPNRWPTSTMRERIALCGGQIDETRPLKDEWPAGCTHAPRRGGSAAVTVRIVIADDQELIRTGFRMILAADPGIEVAAEAGTGSEAIRAARELHPDVVLMDIRMPDLDGIEATRRILAENGPRTQVLSSPLSTSTNTFTKRSAPGERVPPEGSPSAATDRGHPHGPPGTSAPRPGHHQAAHRGVHGTEAEGRPSKSASRAEPA